MSNPKAYLHNTNIFSQAIIEEDESDYDVSENNFYFPFISFFCDFL